VTQRAAQEKSTGEKERFCTTKDCNDGNTVEVTQVGETEIGVTLAGVTSAG
jgi:hypothetical protein